MEKLETRLREVLEDEAARLPAENDIEKRAVSGYLSWLPRPLAAPAAALLVLLVAAPLLWLAVSGDPEPGPGEQAPRPLDLGVDYVWPERGVEATPEALASEFARQALGWSDVTATSPPADPEETVLVTIRDGQGRQLDVISAALSIEGNPERVLIQVGLVGVTVEPVEGRDAQNVAMSAVPGAASAAVHIRYFGSNDVEVIAADESALRLGLVEVESGAPIASVVVVYFDANGVGVTAQGSLFGPFDDSINPLAVAPQGRGAGDDASSLQEAGFLLSRYVPLAMPSRHGDASIRQLELLATFAKGTQPNNTVDMTGLFVAGGFVDTGLRGRWEGSSEIAERFSRSPATLTVSSLMGFTQVGDRLVFNWVLHQRSGIESQGVEATFADGLIQSIEVTSLTVPYCIGGVETGCKDYETGEVRSQQPDLPFCYLNAPTPCRMP